MDTVTLAIVSTLASAAAGTFVGEAAKQAVGGAWQALRSLIVDKYGDRSDVTDALVKLEEKPTMESRQTALSGELVAVGADKDPDLLAAAEALRQALSQAGVAVSTGGQTVTGDYNATADRGSTASVTIHNKS